MTNQPKMAPEAPARDTVTEPANTVPNQTATPPPISEPANQPEEPKKI